MATNIHMACSRGRRGLQTAAALTVFFFGATQAHAQTPPGPPAPASPTTASPTTASPTTPLSTPRVTPPTSATPAPTPDDRSLGEEVPQSIESPPSAETPPPAEPQAPVDVVAPPPVPAAPPEPPPSDVVGPPPPPTPPAGPASDGNLLVKDQRQAQDLRRKGIGVMVAGGVVTLAGVVTSIAFTVRGTQYENLLVQTDEEYNRTDCSSKPAINEGSKCDKLTKQRDHNRESIEFNDRATRAGGAAIAAGVVVTVVGGIIYRLGINKLRSGDVARMKLQPAFGRGFNGLVLTGRF